MSYSRRSRFWIACWIVLVTKGVVFSDFSAAYAQLASGANKPTGSLNKPFDHGPKSNRSDDATVPRNDRAGNGDDSDPTQAPLVTTGRPTLKPQIVQLDPALELLDPRVYRLRVGLKIEAPDGACREVVATAPVPIEWPEQRLRLLNEKISPNVKLTESVLKGQAGIVRLQIPSLSKGQAVVWERLYEITRYRTEFKFPVEELSMPKRLPPELKEQLTKHAPGIETEHPKMTELARSLGHDLKGVDAWDQIKKYWAWTRDNVKFQNGDFRGALFAIEQRCGDCEEMSALFVGLCRLNGAVARTVWVDAAPGHDYPEFYLVDNQGQGHWVPAQVVGPAWFGEITEYRPIFQKGDRFYDPFQKQFVRYAPRTVRADGGGTAPQMTVILEVIADSDINGPTYENPK